MDDLGVFVDRGTTRFVRELGAPRSAAWAALTDAEVLGRWFIPNPCIEYRTGARWWFVSADDPFFQGTIARFVEGRTIEFRYDNTSAMTFTLDDVGEGRCSVVFEHVVPAWFVVGPGDGPSGDGWAEQPAGPGTPQPAVNASWHSNLDALALVLAGASDARVEATARREVADPDTWHPLVERYRAYLGSNAS